MNRTMLVILNLVIATLLAILGNIVANYFQEQWRLSDPARFGMVAILFIVCFVLLLFISFKRQQSELDDSDTGAGEIRVKQKADDIQEGAKITGVEADAVTGPVSVHAKQNARKVSGEMTGVRIGRLGGSESEENK
jgi:predicted PurR-regulated permease PerM